MIKLKDISTLPPNEITEELAEKKTLELAKKIGQLQRIIYAEEKHAVLVIIQGMDASGKDGATRNVFGECGISGTDSYGFKKPTEEEFAHDFLWRIHKIAPRKGYFMIFNRSHYEDVLIQRVHRWIDEDRVNSRIDAINAFETLLEKDNSTTILKFYLHISHEVQQKKLQERIDDPEKNWKHNATDWEESKHWDSYMEAYEDAINRSVIPWHVIPVDKKWYRDYLIAEITHKALLELEPKLPFLDNVVKP